MSIINDALKKAQDGINNNADTPNKDIPPSTPPPSAKTPSRGPNWFLVKLLILFALIIALIPTNMDSIQGMFNSVTMIKETATASIQSITSPTSEQKNVSTVVQLPPAPIAPPPKPVIPSINLEGIMATGDHEYIALISGDVFETGSVVFGWTIEAITKTDIVIRKNDEVQTLTIIGK